MNHSARHSRRSLVDSLEARQLLAGFVANFNFQPKGTPPTNYVADYGRKFADQGDYAFGWNVDNTKRVFDRKTDAKFRYDTLATFGDNQSASTWEVQVPNGLYDVKVMAGDPKQTNSRYAIQAEGVTILDRTPTKASPWRKGSGLVWVSDGRLTLTSAAGAKNNKINNVDIRQVDPHVTGQDIVNPFALQGMVQNEVPTDRAFDALQDLGSKSVRLWYDVKSWKDKPDDAFFDYFAEHKAAGYHTTVIFSTPSVPKAKDVKAFFGRIVAHKGVLDNIDMWQIGNEMNVSTYWTGTLQQYVDRVLAPAYSVIHAAGEPVIGGGISYNVEACAELESYGYSNYVDYAGFHPYGETGEIVIQRARDAKAALGGKPLIITEWNVQGLQWQIGQWANEIEIAAQGLKEIAYLNYYYALEADESHVGLGGAVDIEGEPNEPFYDVIEGWSA